ARIVYVAAGSRLNTNAPSGSTSTRRCGKVARSRAVSGVGEIESETMTFVSRAPVVASTMRPAMSAVPTGGVGAVLVTGGLVWRWSFAPWPRAAGAIAVVAMTTAQNTHDRLCTPVDYCSASCGGASDVAARRDGKRRVAVFRRLLRLAVKAGSYEFH